MREIEPGDVCENGLCEHAATGIWVGNGGPLAITRSHMQFKWCECCMLTVQVEHAEERVRELANLRRQLAAACRPAPVQEQRGEQERG